MRVDPAPTGSATANQRSDPGHTECYSQSESLVRWVHCHPLASTPNLPYYQFSLAGLLYYSSFYDYNSQISVSGPSASQNVQWPRPEWSDFSFERNGLSSFTFGMTAQRGVEAALAVKLLLRLLFGKWVSSVLRGSTLSLFSQCQHFILCSKNIFSDVQKERQVLQVMRITLFVASSRLCALGSRNLDKDLLGASKVYRKNKAPLRSGYMVHVGTS